MKGNGWGGKGSNPVAEWRAFDELPYEVRRVIDEAPARALMMKARAASAAAKPMSTSIHSMLINMGCLSRLIKWG